MTEYNLTCEESGCRLDKYRAAQPFSSLKTVR